MLALAYIASGKLSLLLAVPPGYASPIFPPAGIAVAAAFVGGKRTLPWILLGSAVLNLWIGYEASHEVSVIGIAAAIIIAFASTLQAAAGGWVLRRVIGYPALLDNIRDIGLALLLTPATCLISSTLSVAGLVALGTVNPAAFATNWFSWWLGDTLGLIVLLPIVLAFVSEPRPLWRRRITTIVLPMLVTFSLVVFVFIKASAWEHEQLMSEFRIRAQQVADDIQARFKEQEYFLESVPAFLFHEPTRPVTRERFERTLQRSLAIYPMVQAIEWAPRVTDSQRAEFEANQQPHVPGFRITDPGDGGQLQTAAERPVYYPVTYLVPFAPNQAAIGLDLASTPSRRSALNSTLKLGVPVSTPPFRLVQENADQAGILLMLNTADTAGLPGIVVTVLRAGDFIRSALPENMSEIQLQLSDDAAHQAIFGSINEAAAGETFEQTLEFGTRKYLLHARPTPLYLSHHRGWQSWIVLVVELLGTGLLGGFLLLGTGYTARVEAQVDERTKSLLASRNELNEAQRLAMIGSWVFDLRKNVLTWSDEIFKIFGMDSKSVVPSYDLFLQAIHPEDRAMVDRTYNKSVASHRPYNMVHRLLLPDGRVKFVRERCETHYDDKGVPTLSRGTVQDVSARMKAELKLAESERRYTQLTNNIPDGIYTFRFGADGSMRFLYVSPRFCELLGVEAEVVLNDYTRAFAAAHPDDFDSLVEANAAASTSLVPFRWEGRFIVHGETRWIRLASNPTRLPDGGSQWDGIVTDITENKMMEAELMRLATTDTLTGVANRRRFLEQMQQELARVKRLDMPVSFLMLDIDHFKHVNDTYGHAVGDTVLKHFVEFTTGRLRSIDLFGRLGGEEFGVLLPGTERTGAYELADQLRQYIAATPVPSDKGEIHITVSIGVTEFTPGDITPDGILARADTALYQAKERGRNRVELN